MDILIMIVCAVISIGFLVFIHEGGHYLAARAFGVRVTEFMLGLPGPSIGFTKGETRYGVTAVPLGGYAKVCGMEAGPLQPHLQEALASLYRRGTANMEDVARDCGISDDEAYNALEELVEWGSVIGPSKADQYNTYRAPRVSPGKRALKKAAAAGLPAPATYELGQAREVADPQALYESEYRQQYRSLPFWKRSVILLAGIFMNLLFAMLVFVVVFSVIGFQVQHPETGEITTIHASVLQALQAGFMYIGMVIQAVAGPVQPGYGGSDGVRFHLHRWYCRHVERLLPGGPCGGTGVHGYDLGLAGHHEPAAHPATRWRPLRGGNLPEGHPQDSVPEGHELYVAGRYGALPRLLRHHAEPGHPAVRLRELGLGV